MPNLFEARTILYIKEYDFGNNSPQKDKIAIILAVDNQTTLLIQALVTSQQKIPDKKVNHGCTNSQDNLFSFYCFEAGRTVGKSQNGVDYAFNKTTFIYFQDNVREIEIAQYQPMLSRINPKAVLDESEYQRLITCLLKSRILKRKVKKKLEMLLK